MTISKELLDALLKGCERPEDLLGDAGLMKELKIKLMEWMLEAEPGLFNADYSYRYFSTLLKSIAFRQSASAMLVSPLARRMLRAKLRALTNMAGFVRMRLASSSIATSRT